MGPDSQKAGHVKGHLSGKELDMEELSFRSAGKIDHSVANRTGNFETDCEIWFMVSVQAGIADAEKYKRMSALRDPVRYIKERLSGYVGAAVRAEWGKTVPYDAIGNMLGPVADTVGRVIGSELSPYGLRPVVFRFLSVDLTDECRDALLGHDGADTFPDVPAAGSVFGNVHIDESFRPQNNGDLMSALRTDGDPGSPENASVHAGPVRQEPWVCPRCGTKSTSGKFCPECGDPRP